MDVKPIIIDVDFKRNTMIKEHKVRHGDNVPLMLRVFDDGEAFDLSTMETISLVITRLDRQTIVLLGKVFENQATFNLGGKELAVSGSVQATAQFYSVDGRVSTFNFKLIAESDPITNYIPQKEEETLIVKVLKNGPAVIEAAQTATAGALQAEEMALSAAEETNQSRTNLTDSVNDALDTLEEDKARALLEMAEEKTLTNQVKEETLAVKEEVMNLAKNVGENGVYAREQAERAKAEADRLEGTDVSVLDNKITSINNNLTTQLADTASKGELDETRIKSSWKALNLPLDKLKKVKNKVPFPNGWTWTDVPVKVYKNGIGEFTTDLDIKSYQHRGNGKVYYVDLVKGNDANDGLTPETPLKSVHVARIKSDVDIIEVGEGFYEDMYAFNNNGTGQAGYKNITIRASEGANVILSTRRKLTWTKTPNKVNVYQASRSSVASVWDSANLDKNGDYSRLVKVDTVDLCEEMAGSYCIANNIVYVHPIDNRVADNDIVVFLSVANFKSVGNYKIYLENIKFYGGSIGAVSIESNESGALFASKNCEFKYSSEGSGGLVILGVDSFVEDCIASCNYKDGFNYHYLNPRRPKIIEVNCIGRSNGLDGISQNNGTTVHDGIKILRVNGIYHNNFGPNLHDINEGTESWNIGCESHSSGTALEARNTNYQIESGKMWLDSCIGYGSYRNYRVPSGEINIKNCLFDDGFGTTTAPGSEQFY